MSNRKNCVLSCAAPDSDKWLACSPNGRLVVLSGDLLDQFLMLGLFLDCCSVHLRLSEYRKTLIGKFTGWVFQCSTK